MTPEQMAEAITAIRADQATLISKVEEGNALLRNVLQATETMIGACVNIDTSCRKMLEACEADGGDGKAFFETIQALSDGVKGVAEDVRKLPEEVSGRVAGDVADAVRLFGTEVEAAPATAG